ncbi:MAG: hypothetical protein JO326_14460, partial [Acetobacteraceae bacterium]|nr:hypothetical protein [Acetobacteraceae bacterium]
RFMWISVVVLATLAGAVVWYGMERSLSPQDRYVPARLENGRIVQGHGIAR